MPVAEPDDAGIGAKQQAPPQLGLRREVAAGVLVRWAHAHPAMDRRVAKVADRYGFGRSASSIGPMGAVQAMRISSAWLICDPLPTGATKAPATSSREQRSHA